MTIFRKWDGSLPFLDFLDRSNHSWVLHSVRAIEACVVGVIRYMMLDVLTLYNYSSRSLSYPQMLSQVDCYRSPHNCSLPVKAPF